MGARPFFQLNISDELVVNLAKKNNEKKSWAKSQLLSVFYKIIAALDFFRLQKSSVESLDWPVLIRTAARVLMCDSATVRNIGAAVWNDAATRRVLPVAFVRLDCIAHFRLHTSLTVHISDEWWKKCLWKGDYLYVSNHANSNDISLKIHFFLNF